MARSVRTIKKEQAILEALAKGSSVSAACAHAQVERRRFYEWRESDPEFARSVDEAIDAGTDRLEDVAIRRAEDSSDTLLIFLLKARRREKFGDRQQFEHTGKDGAPLTITIAERSDGPA